MSAFLRFVTPSDVRELKRRLDPTVRGLDATVDSCGKLDEGTRGAWKNFSSSWRKYFDEEDSWLHTAAQMDAGEAYEQDIHGWQVLIASRSCSLTSPVIQPPGAATAETLSTVKTVAIAGAVIAVIVGIKSVMK